eukprot:gene30464-35475_t
MISRLRVLPRKPSANPFQRTSSCINARNVPRPRMVMARAEADVSFSVYCHVPFGTAVVLAGDCEELGNWEIQSGVKMEWNEGDIWTTSVKLPPGSPLSNAKSKRTRTPRLPANAEDDRLDLSFFAPTNCDSGVVVGRAWVAKSPIEFKYVMLEDGCERPPEWTHGANLQLELPADATSAEVKSVTGLVTHHVVTSQVVTLAGSNGTGPVAIEEVPSQTMVEATSEKTSAESEPQAELEPADLMQGAAELDYSSEELKEVVTLQEVAMPRATPEPLIELGLEELMKVVALEEEATIELELEELMKVVAEKKETTPWATPEPQTELELEELMEVVAEKEEATTELEAEELMKVVAEKEETTEEATVSVPQLSSIYPGDIIFAEKKEATVGVARLSTQILFAEEEVMLKLFNLCHDLSPPKEPPSEPAAEPTFAGNIVPGTPAMSTSEAADVSPEKKQ